MSSTIELGCAPAMEGAVHADGQRFNMAIPQVMELPLDSLTQTLSANGASTGLVRISGAPEAATLLAINKALGGTCSPKILGIVMRFEQTVSLPATAGMSGTHYAGIHERLAHHKLNVTPGQNSSDYFMTRADISVGQFELYKRLGGFVDAIQAVCDEFCHDNATSLSRSEANIAGTGFSAPDQYPVITNRPAVAAWYPRAVISGTAQDSPGAFEPAADVVLFPFTADGFSGVSSAGRPYEEVFDSVNVWQFSVTRGDNTNLYRGATFGTLTIRFSVLYAVHQGKHLEGENPVLPTYGLPWRWNNNAGTAVSGTDSNVTGGAIEDLITVGFFPEYYPLTSTAYPVLETETGVATSRVGLAFDAPLINPATMLNTKSSYWMIGDQSSYQFPLGGNLNDSGYSVLNFYNARFRKQAADAGYEQYRQGIEVPIFSDSTTKTATTSYLTYYPNGSLRFGTIAGWAGATPIVTTWVNRGAEPNVVGIGGLMLFPLAWCDRQANGFAGVQPRARGDLRPLRVNTAANCQWPFPTPVTTTGKSRNIQVFSLGGRDTAGGACSVKNTVPVVPNPASPAFAMAAKLSASIKPVSGSVSPVNLGKAAG